MKSQPWYITPKISYKEKRAIVIGGGLAGTSAAYSFAKRGWEVVLIERSQELANGASGNPIGLVSPMLAQRTDPIAEFYWNAFKYSLEHLNNLQVEEQGEIFNPCGILDLSKAESNLASNIVPENEVVKLSEEEASIVAGIKLWKDALHIPGGGFAYPRKICQANLMVFKDKIQVILSSDVLSIKRHENEWQAVDVVGNKISAAPVCVIANAADAREFDQSSFIPLQKVRGQLTYLSQQFNLHKILCYEGGYISPAISGMHYVGATYSRENFFLELSEEDNQENISNLQEAIGLNVSDLNDAASQHGHRIKGRASLRAMVPDRRPVIGQVPDMDAFQKDYADLKHGKVKEYPEGKYLEGLYISTGHGSRGLVSTPIAGEMIAAMANNESLPLSGKIINTLNPARFLIKTLQGRV